MRTAIAHAAELMTGHAELMTGTTMTAEQRSAVQRYEAAIAGIPDCFDVQLGDSDATTEELVALAPLLGQWWEAIDSLDADIAAAGIAADHLLSGVVDEFLTARQWFLFGLATAAGTKLPRPDYNAGWVATSNHPRGYFGYHDPDLDYRLMRRHDCRGDHPDHGNPTA